MGEIEPYIEPAAEVSPQPATAARSANCEVCRASISTGRSDKRFCCDSHRAAAARIKHDERIREEVRKESRLLFVSGRSPTARQCSYEGAQAAAGRAPSQLVRYLRLLSDKGPLTDHRAAAALGIAITSICARRGFCLNQANPWVEATGREPGPFGTPNTRYGLTSRGRAEVEAAGA